jgi:O-antigen ligase
LSDTDISNIEKGYTNHIFADNWSLYPRIYETIWELDQKRYSGNANAHSLTMRFVYMGISYEFFKQNKWLGIGAGNIKDDYKQYYATHNTGIEPSRQHITHNQFLLFLTVFGIVGFILILFAFTLPPIIEKAYNSYYFLVVFIVVFLSFLNEDTLETQVGVTFVAFFYSLSLWGIQTDSNQKNDQPAIE